MRRSRDLPIRGLGKLDTCCLGVRHIPLFDLSGSLTKRPFSRAQHYDRRFFRKKCCLEFFLTPQYPWGKWSDKEETVPTIRGMIIFIASMSATAFATNSALSATTSVQNDAKQILNNCANAECSAKATKSTAFPSNLSSLLHASCSVDSVAEIKHWLWKSIDKTAPP